MLRLRALLEMTDRKIAAELDEVRGEAERGQISDERLDRGDKPSIRQRRATSTTRGGPVPGREVRARDAQGCGHRAHRPAPGHEVTRKGSFLGAVTRSTASRRISFSSVFLPSRRCSSRIC